LDESGKQELGNCVMYALPGNELCLEAFNACVVKDKNKIKFGQTGPVLIREFVKMLDLKRFASDYKTFCPINYYELNKIVTECENIDMFITGSYAIHLWNELWRRSGIDKNGDFPPDSLYQKLLYKYGL
jgi:hypothetical protein